MGATRAFLDRLPTRKGSPAWVPSTLRRGKCVQTGNAISITTSPKPCGRLETRKPKTTLEQQHTCHTRAHPSKAIQLALQLSTDRIAERSVSCPLQQRNPRTTAHAIAAAPPQCPEPPSRTGRTSSIPLRACLPRHTPSHCKMHQAARREFMRAAPESPKFLVLYIPRHEHTQRRYRTQPVSRPAISYREGVPMMGCPAVQKGTDH